MFNFSFRDHPVTSTLLYATCICSVLHGVQWDENYGEFDLNDVFISPTLGHLFQVLTMPFYYDSAGELLLVSVLLVYTGAQIETLWGSPKTASILLSSHVLGWTARLLAFRFWPSLPVVVPGLYFSVMALTIVVRRNTPQSFPFAFYGFPVDSHTPMLLFVIQIASINLHTAVMVLCGILAGIIAASHYYKELPSLWYRFFVQMIPRKDPHIDISTSQQLLRVIS
eukprot:TRINITY_DN2268_c1_g1_i1.p1 TRINITY_DN2268_c1_g1~~TRINITY_DN2268_c1_g1_i1.p1  ORF type:complete len:225 (+),score=9.96 TRINITY_DN2268_c1_g1_i1:106-780(+)